MVEAFVPSFQSSLLQLNNLLAKSAPEAALSIPPYTTALAFVTDMLFITDIVVLTKVNLKGITAVEYLGTLIYLALRTGLVTTPCLQLIVLGVLVAFPVILTAKCLVTRSVSTAVRPAMTFLVLPDRQLVFNLRFTSMKSNIT